jgi:4-oxalomesaconate hydratase
MSGVQRLLVVGAHAADFVWRAGGVIALVTANGGEAIVLALSYGERGESGELWKEPGQTVERVKAIRHEQAERAAHLLGARFVSFDLGDYPLEVDREATERLAQLIRDFRPDAIVTHTPTDPPGRQPGCSTSTSPLLWCRRRQCLRDDRAATFVLLRAAST